MFKNQLRRALYLRLPYLGAAGLWCVPFLLAGIWFESVWAFMLLALGAPIFLLGAIVPQFDILYLTRDHNILRVGLTIAAILLTIPVVAFLVPGIFDLLRLEPTEDYVSWAVLTVIILTVASILYVLLGRIADPISGPVSRAIYSILTASIGASQSIFLFVAMGAP